MKIKSIPNHLLGITRFDVQISDIQAVENTLFSKCFIKILYPGLNRNDVFIEKEVANEMVKSIYNIPIIGEYIEHKDDFGSHGGKIEITESGIEFIQTTKPWGLIPESTEIAWQDVIEEDGTRNEYLTATGYLWTGRYPELNDVINSGRAQSMELYEDTLEGFWEKKQGREIFHITKADFSALCILGNDVPPAFESATIGSYYVSNPISFSKKYSRLLRDFEASVEPDLKQVSNFSSSANDNKGTQLNEGGQNMSLQFMMDLDQDNIKYKLYDALHPVNDEGNRTWIYSIVDVTDDAIVLAEESTNKFYTVTYVITDEVVTIGEEKTEIEYAEKIAAQAAPEDRTEIEALQAQFVAIQEELEQYKSNEDNSEFEALKVENTTLKEFKEAIEAKDKDEVIAEFAAVLTEEELEPFKTNIATYTKSDLEKDLAVVAYKKNKAKITESNLIPDPDNTNSAISGVEKIIQKWTK